MGGRGVEKSQKSGRVFIVLFSIPISDPAPPYKQLDQHDSSKVPYPPPEHTTMFPIPIPQDPKPFPSLDKMNREKMCGHLPFRTSTLFQSPPSPTTPRLSSRLTCTRSRVTGRRKQECWHPDWKKRPSNVTGRRLSTANQRSKIVAQSTKAPKSANLLANSSKLFFTASVQ